MGSTNRFLGIACPVIALLLAALACGPIPTIVVTATPEPTIPARTPEAPATPIAVALPTETPLEPTTAAGCTLGARYVADVSVQDNTGFAPGTPFVKTWRVRNSGTCAWEPGTRLVFTSGDPMGGPPAVDVPTLPPGAQTDVSVNLIAPATPDTYRGNYQFRAPNGTRFGAVIYVQIVVQSPTGAPTPEPTTAPVLTEAPTAPAPTEAPTPAPTTAPAPADLSIPAVEFRPPSPTAGTPFAVDIRISNSGFTDAANFGVRVIRLHTPGSACPGGGGTVLLDRRFSVDAGDLRIFSENAQIDAPGTYGICVILDTLNEIAESNESNNAFYKDITIRGGSPPDLSVRSIDLSNWTPRVNEDVQASIALENTGDVPVSDFTVRVVQQNPGNACPGAGTVVLDTRTSLDAHGAVRFRPTLRFARAGTFQLCVILDHMNRVAESDENNNACKSDRNVVVSQ